MSKAIRASQLNDVDIEVFNQPQTPLFSYIENSLNRVMRVRQRFKRASSPYVIGRIYTLSKEIPFLEFRTSSEPVSKHLRTHTFGNKEYGDIFLIKLVAISSAGTANVITEFEWRELRTSVYRKTDVGSLETAKSEHRKSCEAYLSTFQEDLTDFLSTLLSSLNYGGSK